MSTRIIDLHDYKKAERWFFAQTILEANRARPDLNWSELSETDLGYIKRRFKRWYFGGIFGNRRIERE